MTNLPALETGTRRSGRTTRMIDHVIKHLLTAPPESLTMVYVGNEFEMRRIHGLIHMRLCVNRAIRCIESGGFWEYVITRYDGHRVRFSVTLGERSRDMLRGAKEPDAEFADHYFIECEFEKVQKAFDKLQKLLKDGFIT